MGNCDDPFAGDRAEGCTWCLWVSGGRQDVSRRHEMTIGISLDDQKRRFSDNGRSTLPLVPARCTAAIAQGCVSRGAGAAVDAS